MFEIPDREVRVVSADVPTQPGETDEQCIQCENANVARATRRQQEVDVAAAAAGHPAGNVAEGAGDQSGGNIINGAQPAPAAPQ
jgi:hypothetical protein